VEVANQIADLVLAEFPDARLYVRSWDRGHTLQLLAKGVDYELRETYESALAFGKRTLVELGVDEEEAQAVQDDVRRRDLERLALQQAEGQLMAGIDLIKRPIPEPLRAPARQSRPLNPEADDIIHSETEFSG
jgi:voltage-gated potassium channel Kch